ncbi:MAG: TonB-dependent receptor [Methylococcales bacterium]|nr:TonB-dependent receptor [Methylococcales bacterium]
MINLKHSTLNTESARHDFTKAAVIVLAIPALALSMITSATAETDKKLDSKMAKSKTSTAKNVPSSEERIIALDEMTVSDKQSRIDNWLTEDIDAIPVQKRTELGHLTMTTPLAGSVIDQQELKTVKYVDLLREQLTRIPGVSMVRNIRIPDGGKSYTSGLVDGFNTGSPSNGNTSNNIDTVNPKEIESMEVIRGPASVLYPSNAIGGTINIITKDPSKHPEYSLSQEIGMYDLYRTQGSASGTVKSPLNDIGYFVGFSALQYNPWRERSRSSRTSGSGKVVFHPDDKSKLTLRFDYTDWYQQAGGNLTREQWVNNWRQTNTAMPNLYQDFQYISGVASYKRQIGEGGELEVSFSKRDRSGIDVGGCCANTQTQQYVDQGQNNAHTVYRQDFDLAKSRVYTGVDVINGYQGADTWNRTPDGMRVTTRSSASLFNETQVAPFAQYEFSPFNGLFKEGFLSSLDNLRFNFGMRYEDIQQRYSETYKTTGGALKSSRQELGKLIKKGGLDYEYVKDHTLWFGVADGWLVPGASSNVTAQYPNENINPETSITKQLGLRGFFREQGLTYDITAFETNIDNYIASVLCSDNPSMCGAAWSKLPNTITTGRVTTVNTAKTTASYTGNPGKVTVRGFETSLAYQPHEMVKFSVAHTLNWNFWNNYNLGAVKLNGVTMVSAPKHHVNGRVTVYPLSGLSVELEADYMSRYYTNIQNTNTYSRPMLFNLRSSYQWKNWTLSLQAINLLNTKYSSRVNANAANVQTYSGLAGISDGPFQFRAAVEYNF